jgi:hypothetical protein
MSGKIIDSTKARETAQQVLAAADDYTCADPGQPHTSKEDAA